MSDLEGDKEDSKKKIDDEEKTKDTNRDNQFDYSEEVSDGEAEEIDLKSEVNNVEEKEKKENIELNEEKAEKIKKEEETVFKEDDKAEVNYREGDEVDVNYRGRGRWYSAKIER